MCGADELPASVKPGGVLPSPTLVERQAQAAQAARDQAEMDAALAPAQKGLDAALRILGVGLAVEATAVEGPWAASRGKQWAERYGATLTDREIRAGLDAHTERLTALETVAALAGWGNASKVASALPRLGTGPTAA